MILENVQKTLRPYVLSLKRMTVKSPFADGQDAKLIVHCGYHRAGTTWFNNILSGIAETFGLRYQNCEQYQLRPKTEIYLQNDSNVDLTKLRPHVGSHMIRDPRDMIVSGYFYHKWTKEPWALEPNPDYGGQSYQAYLQGLDQEEGLMAEIKRTGPNIRRMLTWRYGNPDFIELKYEQVISHEETAFPPIFRKYGFSDWAVERCMEVVHGLSFEKVAGRKIGQVRNKSHLRSGKPGGWQEYFTEDHERYFEALYGDALLRLGYKAEEAD